MLKRLPSHKENRNMCSRYFFKVEVCIPDIQTLVGAYGTPQITGKKTAGNQFYDKEMGLGW